jgi:hypothetical protein
MKTVQGILLTGLIAFTLACGYSKPANMAATNGTVPTIAALAPNNTNSGGATFVLTVNGSSFASNATVNWNGTVQTTSFVSASQITTMVPASAIATPATIQVTVTNPGTSGGIYGGGTLPETSTAMDFTVN